MAAGPGDLGASEGAKGGLPGRRWGGGEGIGELQQTGDSDMDVSFKMLLGLVTIYHSFT